MEGDYARFQRDFHQTYGEHKELSQYVWKAMHTMFPITTTYTVVSQLLAGEDGEDIGPSMFR